MEIDISRRTVGGLAVLDVIGELDLYTAPKFRAALDVVLADGGPAVVVNLLGTTYLDSTGLSLLASAMRLVRQRGGNLAVISDQPQINRMFSITGLDRIFSIFSSEQAALDGAAQWVTAPAGS